MPGADKFFITTAIYYPNNRPHIGTAFEIIGTDVQARFRHMQGHPVFFLTGNDEHTVKVARRAAELGIDPKTYVDDMARLFKDVWAGLDIAYDGFIQTSEDRHKEGCRRFIQRVYDAGDIYRGPYEGLYCEGCESFKSDRDLVDGRCPNHPTQELKRVRETNYFFALSKYRDRLLKWYEDHPNFIWPRTRRNEITSLVEGGLQDVSISRQGIEWGIPVPFDPAQTIYVWFDALLNYITGIGYGTDDNEFARWWPADVHVIGKDITRFHCALWPAMLMSAGLEPPRQVVVHGFIYHKGEKVSKSLGNVVDPMELVERYGSDAFRYFLLRECPFGGDGDFSYDRFVNVYNADLANNLGNLYSRTLTMCQRYFGGRLEGSRAFEPREVFAEIDLTAVVQRTREQVESCSYNEALATIWQQVLDSANRYVEHTKPFALAKTDLASCKVVLVNLVEALRVAAILIKPFMPRASAWIHGGFNFSEPFDRVSFAGVAGRPPQSEDLRITAALDSQGKVAPLFPRIQTQSKLAPVAG